MITPDGIVGKLVDVFPHTSQVLEINDQTSGAGVLLDKTRMRGVLRGNADGQTQIINVLPDDRVQAGRESCDQRRRSDISLRARRWARWSAWSTILSANPYVAVRRSSPAANLSRLDEVLVITETKDTMPATMQQDDRNQ